MVFHVKHHETIDIQVDLTEHSFPFSRKQYMANFQTHLTCGVIVSATAASTALSLQLVDQTQALILLGIGAIGGILPDIDSDNSNAQEILFNILAVLMVLFLSLWLSNILSIVGLWLMAALVFIMIRYVLIELFEQFTVHRGSLHSLLACCMFGLLAVHISLLSGMGVTFSWCAGSILIIGMLTHLTLDELYSVDFANSEIKRSFGSALKPASLLFPGATFCQLVTCAALIYYLPSPQGFIEALQGTQVNFLPTQDWMMLKRMID